MEVCKGTTAPRESDMGDADPDSLLTVPGAGGPRVAAMERREHISSRDAKVRALELFLFYIPFQSRRAGTL